MKQYFINNMTMSKIVLNAVLAVGIFGLTTVSCVRDSFVSNLKHTDGQIEFDVKTGEDSEYCDTKSGLVQDPIMLVSDHNDTLYLTISAARNKDMRLNSTFDGTKGQPVTTENIGQVYSKFNVVAYSSGTVASPYLTDQPTYNSVGGIWKTSTVYFWPTETNLDFYAYAPVDITGLSNLSYASGNVIGFSYQLPTASGDNDAKGQKDLLFATTKDVSGNTDGGKVSFTFEHALAAIQFVSGNIKSAGTIQKISLKNLSSSGDATFEGGTREFSWTNLDEQNHTYAQTFSVNLAKQTTPQDITKTDETTTFMMIPQVIDGTTSILEITFLIAGSATPVLFSIPIPAIEWEAGYTYTYKLGLDATSVDVDVDDIVDDNVKSSLVISNKGEADSYIRVTMIGNWINVDNEIVADWNESDGVFTDFPGADWKKGNDGYYYYANPVDAASSPDNPTVIPSPLFTSYSVTTQHYSGANLILDIVVQGVKYDPYKTNVTSAWGAEAASLLNTK